MGKIRNLDAGNQIIVSLKNLVGDRVAKLYRGFRNELGIHCMTIFRLVRYSGRADIKHALSCRATSVVLGHCPYVAADNTLLRLMRDPEFRLLENCELIYNFDNFHTNYGLLSELFLATEICGTRGIWRFLLWTILLGDPLQPVAWAQFGGLLIRKRCAEYVQSGCVFGNKVGVNGHMTLRISAEINRVGSPIEFIR